MATTLSATVSLAAVGTYAESGSPLTDNVQRISEAKILDFTDGTGTNQANRWLKLTGTNVASVQSIFLIAALEDAFGTTLRFDLVKAVVVINTDTTAGEDLTVAGSFGLSGVVHPNGGWLAKASPTGYAVTNAVNDEITLDAGANTVTYEVWILGVDT